VGNNLNSALLFALGDLQITLTVVTTWGIMALLGFVSWLAMRNRETRNTVDLTPPHPNPPPVV
jgi:hypothetical protein